MNKYDAKLYVSLTNVPDVIEWFITALGRSKEALEHGSILFDNFTTIVEHMTSLEEKVDETH